MFNKVNGKDVLKEAIAEVHSAKHLCLRLYFELELRRDKGHIQLTDVCKFIQL